MKIKYASSTLFVVLLHQAIVDKASALVSDHELGIELGSGPYPDLNLVALCLRPLGDFYATIPTPWTTRHDLVVNVEFVRLTRGLDEDDERYEFSFQVTNDEQHFQSKAQALACVVLDFVVKGTVPPGAVRAAFK